MKKKITAYTLANKAMREILHQPENDHSCHYMKYKGMDLDYWDVYRELDEIPLKKFDEAVYSSKAEYGGGGDIGIYGDAIVNFDCTDHYMVVIKTLEQTEKYKQIMKELLEAFIDKFYKLVDEQLRLERNLEAYKVAYSKFDKGYLEQFDDNSVNEKRGYVYFDFYVDEFIDNKDKLPYLWELYQDIPFDVALQSARTEHGDSTKCIGLEVAVEVVVSDGMIATNEITIALLDQMHDEDGTSCHEITQMDDKYGLFSECAIKLAKRDWGI